MRRLPVRAYQVYGVQLRSQWRLPCHEGADPGLEEIELFESPAALFSEAFRDAQRRRAKEEWFSHVRLPNGADYLCWSGLFEFVVSADGRRIAGHPLNGTSREALHTYLLAQVLSFALLKQGIEPLHCTAVVVDGKAVGFLGDCGYGKSTLGAAFLRAGWPLLTDDLLVVKEDGHGFVAYPGPARIKLFPDVARSLLGERVMGIRMNPLTAKLVIPLEQDGRTFWPGASPLKAIYVLTAPEGSQTDSISIRPLSPQRAFLELVRNTFNAMVVEPERLKRQFDLASRLASRIPVRSVSFPRTLAYLPSVREAIRSDLVA